MQSSNESKYIRLNLITSILFQVITVVISMASRLVVNRYLGINYLGLLSVFVNFCDIFTFALAGIAVSFYHKLYKPISENDESEISSIYNFYKKIYTRVAIGILIVGLLANIVIGLVIDDTIAINVTMLSYSIYLLSVVIVSANIIKQYFIIANKRHYIVLTVNIVVELSFFIIQTVGVLITKSFYFFIILYVVKSIVFNIVFKYIINKEYTFLNKNKDFKWITDTHSLYKDLKSIVLTKIGDLMVHNTDNIIISAAVGTAASGIYSNYLLVYTGAIAVASTYFTAVTAKIGTFIAKNNSEIVFKDFLKNSGFAIVINGFCTTCFYILIQDFIFVWMGNASVLSHNVALLVTINLYLYTSRTVSAVYRNGAGLFLKIGNVNILRGIINLALSIYLSINFGIEGVLLATIISNLSTAYVYEIIVLYRYFKKSLAYEIAYQILSIGSILISINLIGNITQGLVNDTIFVFLLKSIICAVIAGIIYGIFYLVYTIVGRKFLWEEN